jgi:predicted dehydrogenase
MTSQRLNRRRFLASAGAGAAVAGLWQVVPRRVLGGPGQPPPSEALRYAVIGLGMHGRGWCMAYSRKKDGRLVAICDCDPVKLEKGRKEFAPTVRSHQGHELACYTDFRDLLERTDLDVVHVGTPPHWHALISIMAMQVGMDVFCTKPMTRFLAEARAMVETAKQYGRICLITSGCFTAHMPQSTAVARKLARAGLLGKPLTGRVRLPYGSGGPRALPKNIEPPPESNLVYDMWCGPSPYKPWVGIVHGGFRRLWDYDGGAQADFAPHYTPAILEILNKFGEDPIEFEGEGQWPPNPSAPHGWHQVTARYADGTKLILESSLWREDLPQGAFQISGPKGRFSAIKALHDNRSEPAELIAEAAKLPDDPKRISFYEAFRTRNDKHADHPSAEIQFRTTKILHLSNIALRTGRKIVWDPQKQTIVGDEQAASLLDIPVRAPWRLY